MKVQADGRRFVLLASNRRESLWVERPRFPASSKIQWLSNGRFRLDLDLRTQAQPRACALKFRFPEGGELLTGAFGLHTLAPDSLEYVGDGPHLRLSKVPVARSNVPRAPRARAWGPNLMLAEDITLGGLVDDGADLGHEESRYVAPSLEQEREAVIGSIRKHLNAFSADALEDHLEALRRLEAAGFGNRETGSFRALLSDISKQRRFLQSQLPGSMLVGEPGEKNPAQAPGED
ncbi:hypothetical protein IV102_02550 [bacterium]|nr:hypothetical protein [bacterium]